MSDQRVAYDLARKVASYGLRGQSHESWSIPDEKWSGFLALIKAQRLSGLATAAYEGGWLELSDDQAEALLDVQVRLMMHAVGAEHDLLVIAENLRRADVGFVVLKGSSVAHSCYPDPSWRAFGDLDILVRTRDWRRACVVLAENGYARELPEPVTGFDERYGKAAAHRNSSGLEVDLHRTLVLGPFGLWLDPDELFDNTDRFRVGGIFLPRLNDSAILLNVCLHASLGWRPVLLSPLRDVAQVATNGEIDWDLIVEWARRWNLGAVFQHAFQTAEEALGAELPGEALELAQARPPRSELRALESYSTDRRHKGGMALSTLRAIPGVSSKMDYVRMMLLPKEEFLEARSRNGHRHAYLDRWKIPLRWLTAGRR